MTSPVKAQRSSPLAFYLIWLLLGPAFAFISAFLVRVLQLGIPPFLLTVPCIFLAQGLAYAISEWLGFPVLRREIRTLESINSNALGAEKADLQAKPLSWQGVLLVAIGLSIFHGWNIVTLSNVNLGLIVVIVGTAILSGILALKERPDFASFTRIDARGLTYRRGWKRPQTILWSQVGCVEQVEKFDDQNRLSGMFWQVHDVNGQPLLTVPSYSSSLGEQQRFSQVVSRYLGASSSV